MGDKSKEELGNPIYVRQPAQVPSPQGLKSKRASWTIKVEGDLQGLLVYRKESQRRICTHKERKEEKKDHSKFFLSTIPEVFLYKKKLSALHTNQETHNDSPSHKERKKKRSHLLRLLPNTQTPHTFLQNIHTGLPRQTTFLLLLLFFSFLPTHHHPILPHQPHT